MYVNQALEEPCHVLGVKKPTKCELKKNSHYFNFISLMWLIIEILFWYVSLTVIGG